MIPHSSFLCEKCHLPLWEGKQKTPSSVERGVFFLSELKNKLKNSTGKNGNSKEETGKAEAFDFVDIVAEKNEKTGSCTCGKSGKCSSERNGSFCKKLCNDNGRSTVRDKTDKTGNKGLEKAFLGNKVCKSFFADGFDAKFKAEHYDKDECKGFCGVEKGAFEKSVASFGVAMGMFSFNVIKFFFGDVEKSEAVNKETCNNCKDEFGTDKRKDFSCAFRVGKKNGNCLIAGGNENRKHSTGGYDSVGIKVCRNNGKTALGNKSEESADCGTGFSEFSEPCGKFFGMAVFYKFDEQIGSEKERKGRNGMLKGVCENMEKFLHLFYLVYNGFLNNILYFQTHFPSRIFWKKE